jgi:uncharacterized membrane protein
MASGNTEWTDQRVEMIVGNLLRAGVILAASVTLLGGVLYLIQHGGDPAPRYRQYIDPRRAGARTPDGASPMAEIAPNELSIIVRLALAGRSRGIIQLGVLLLIATPIARVIFSIVAFAVQRDWTYIGVTLVVLAVLLYSFFTGLFG